MPGRPAVEPYLHGIDDRQLPETHVAWRDEVWELRKRQRESEVGRDQCVFEAFATELVDDFPLKPHELLREPSHRAFKHFEALAKRLPDAPVWLLDEQGAVKALTLSALADKNRKDRIEGRTVLLPPDAGGLAGGMLDGASERANDVSCGWFDEEGDWRPWADESGLPYRVRVWSDDDAYDEKTKGMRRVRSIEFESDEFQEGDDLRRWDWYEAHALEGGRTATREVEWQTHVNDVVSNVRRIVGGLSLPQDIADAIVLAAKLHDHGKKRERFQITLGNRDYPDRLLAKSGRSGARLPEPFRHEFASLAYAADDPQMKEIPPLLRDLVLHLIAAHHGRARPHFPVDEAFDPERSASDAEAISFETPRRFARLQRQYGRWGLAFLESLLRAADWAASAKPSQYEVEG
jgi:CRISPR-associated endonuclease/helicase Cas3